MVLSSSLRSATPDGSETEEQLQLLQDLMFRRTSQDSLMYPRHISKRGSAALRKVLFQITEVFILSKPENEPVYQFIIKKRSEGKHYYSYRIAAANKFLRIYYAKVNQILNAT